MVLPKSDGTPYLMGSTEENTAEGRVDATKTTVLLVPVMPKSRVAKRANTNPPTSLMMRPPAICQFRCHLVLFSETPRIKAAKGGAAPPANSKVVTREAGMQRFVMRKRNAAKIAQRMGDFTIDFRDFLVRPPVMMSMPKVKIKIVCTWS